MILVRSGARASSRHGRGAAPHRRPAEAVDTTDRVLRQDRSATDARRRHRHRSKRQLGPDAELLDITFTGRSGNVKYRDGDGAAGFQWGPGRDGLERVNVTLIGAGRLADNVFPIAKLDPAAPAKLTEGGSGLRAPLDDARASTPRPAGSAGPSPATRTAARGSSPPRSDAQRAQSRAGRYRPRT